MSTHKDQAGNQQFKMNKAGGMDSRQRTREALPSRDTESEESFGYRLLSSALLFGLLAEWMLPWANQGSWAGIYQPAPLLVIIGCILLLGLFRMPGPVTLSMNIILCLLSFMWMYKSPDENGIRWLFSMPGMVKEHAGLLWEHGVWAMSAELRTLLLFIGWAMLAPALQGLMWMRQTALGVAGLTIGYLVTLHLFLGFDVMNNLQRASAEGLLLGAVVSIPRIRRITASDSGGTERLDMRWVAGSVFVVLIMLGCGMLLANGREEAMPPAGWTTALTARLEQAVSTLGSRDGTAAVMASADPRRLGSVFAGYSFDDHELGAPVSLDDQIVFTGSSSAAAYWRGESKRVYDGRGWSEEEGNTPELLKIRSPDAEATLSAATAAGSLEHGQFVRQTVVWAEPEQGMPLLSSGLYGRVTELIAADPRRMLGSYYSDEETGSLYGPSSFAKVESYTVESVLAETDAVKLRALGSLGQAEEVGGASEAELESYLQLPDSLPERVTALGAEIAGGGVTNRYDQVKAVEQYLENSYAYTLEGSELPPEGSDFVDHFLFEQKQGYCVHFSTAMVVLLRTQNIPARWVKGFTPGTAVDSGSSGEGNVSGIQTVQYEVRGSDAHAWVEVYFPGAGWVPFDPTPGFAGGVHAAAAAASAGGAELASPAGEAGLAGWLEAAAGIAASALARGADALAQAAQSAAKGAAAAAASPAVLAGAGAAALALAGAALAAAQRQRLRVALALRRYGAAYADAAAPAPSREAVTDGRRRTMARGRRKLSAPRDADARLRSSFASVVESTLTQLQRRLGGHGQPMTAREFAIAAEPALGAEQQDALRQLVSWVEEARFAAPGQWPEAPTPAALRSVLRVLNKRRASEGKLSRAYALKSPKS